MFYNNNLNVTIIAQIKELNHNHRESILLHEHEYFIRHGVINDNNMLVN